MANCTDKKASQREVAFGDEVSVQETAHVRVGIGNVKSLLSAVLW